MTQAKLVIEAEFNISELDEVRRVIDDELRGYCSIKVAKATIPAETVLDLR